MATDLSADFKRINRMSIADKKQCSGLHLGLFLFTERQYLLHHNIPSRDNSYQTKTYEQK